MLLLSWLACFWSSADEEPQCAEPHLFYAPDGSGDVYFGCDRPAGWLDVPPDEEEFVWVPTPLPERAWVERVADGPEGGAARETGRPVLKDTGYTGETGAPAPSRAPDTSDTAEPWVDTADTGFLDTADTGLLLEEEELPLEEGMLVIEGWPAEGAEQVEVPAVDTALPLPTGLTIEVPSTGGDDGT